MAETIHFGDIQVLTYMEAIQKRPTMYVGPLDDRALVHLVLAVLSTSLEQAETGQCSEIRVLVEDGWIEVADDGCAPWLDPLPSSSDEERTRLGRSLTLLHVGGSWPDTAIAVALSLAFRATARRGDRTENWWFQHGRKVASGPGVTVGDKSWEQSHLVKDGTVFQFLPDPAFFGGHRIDREHLARTLAGIATTARLVLW